MLQRNLLDGGYDAGDQENHGVTFLTIVSIKSSRDYQVNTPFSRETLLIKGQHTSKLEQIKARSSDIHDMDENH